MADAKYPSKQTRPMRDPATAPAPDPADLGTAFGMEMSIGATDGSSPDAAATAADEDPLSWIRRWLDRHTPR